ncbi:TnsA endonuclease N-terminal domain-containing protein [Aquimarina algiphila]|uniref:TnsA endonuclease N-terminal domain-containing protein n=1 Tax=Aquimarina algiphila TaxID=2047982 RepID=UPI002330B083|nr:TnsA endonuclease N-terminal domain-containing protein [Aquimarina algiphila]
MKTVSLKVLDKAIWFSPPNNRIKKSDFEKPFRKIYLNKSSEESPGTSGFFKSKKCNKEVYYESHLELKLFSTLELAEQVIDFGSQPMPISFKYNERISTYHPDFYYLLSDNTCVLGEVKMLYEMGYFYNWSKWKGLKHYCRKNGIGFLITDGKYDIRDLKEMYINRNFRDELLTLFQKTDCVDWNTIYDLKLKYGLKMLDLACFVYQENVRWYRKPTRFVKESFI